MSQEIAMQDSYTYNHCTRIADLAVKTGRELGCTSESLLSLSYGGFFHDIGKIKIPREILQKQSALTEQDWDIVKQHPVRGKEMLSSYGLIQKGLLANAPCPTIIIEQHHERMDGSGYPFQLAGDEICIEAYIVGVADTFDAMTTDRSYRAGLPTKVALEEIARLRGVQFPDKVVGAFIAMLDKDAITYRHDV